MCKNLCFFLPVRKLKSQDLILQRPINFKIFILNKNWKFVSLSWVCRLCNYLTSCLVRGCFISLYLSFLTDSEEIDDKDTVSDYTFEVSKCFNIPGHCEVTIYIICFISLYTRTTIWMGPNETNFKLSKVLQFSTFQTEIKFIWLSVKTLKKKVKHILIIVISLLRGQL